MLLRLVLERASKCYFSRLLLRRALGGALPRWCLACPLSVEGVSLVVQVLVHLLDDAVVFNGPSEDLTHSAGDKTCFRVLWVASIGRH